jgi:hypothetical protein
VISAERRRAALGYWSIGRRLLDHSEHRPAWSVREIAHVEMKTGQDGSARGSEVAAGTCLKVELALHIDEAVRQGFDRQAHWRSRWLKVFRVY